jgi:nitrate reductase NapAB chaperone NapD
VISASLVYLPALVSPEERPALYLALLLAAAALSGLFVSLFYRLYSQGLPDADSWPLLTTLLPTTLLSALVVHQAAQWPAMPLFLIALLALLHFRTVIRQRRDLIFVGAALLAGLLTGLGFAGPVLLVSGLGFALGALVLNRRLARQSYRFVIRCDPSALAALEPLLLELKGEEVSRQETDGMIDLVLMVRLREASMSVVDQVTALPGVHKAVLIARS